MSFEEFLKTKKHYKGLYILDEYGNKLIMESTNNNGLKTTARVKIYNSETMSISENSIYLSNYDFLVLYKQKLIPLSRFTDVI